MARLSIFIIMLFSIDAIATLGGAPNPIANSPLKDRIEPSNLYFYVIIPVFSILVFALFFLCRRHFTSLNAKKHLILPILSGIVLFMCLPCLYTKFFQIFIELETDISSLPAFDFPYLASGKITYGTLLIVIWLCFQPIILQAIFKRKDKPFLYFPFILFFFAYVIWFFWALFSPLMAIYG